VMRIFKAQRQQQSTQADSELSAVCDARLDASGEMQLRAVRLD
jgi:hypothetical protein